MPIKEMTCEEVKAALSESETLFIDVRSGDEYTGELGHIKGVQLRTLGEDLDKFKASLNDKAKKIVFVCRSGNRSGKATSLFQEEGFSNCFNMTGGMLKWNDLKFEVEK